MAAQYHHIYPAFFNANRKIGNVVSWPRASVSLISHHMYNDDNHGLCRLPRKPSRPRTHAHGRRFCKSASICPSRAACPSFLGCRCPGDALADRLADRHRTSVGRPTGQCPKNKGKEQRMGEERQERREERHTNIPGAPNAVTTWLPVALCCFVAFFARNNYIPAVDTLLPPPRSLRGDNTSNGRVVSCGWMQWRRERRR